VNGKVLGSGEILTIRNINRTDSGFYICSASNGVLGSAVANSSVNVQCKCTDLCNRFCLVIEMN